MYKSYQAQNLYITKLTQAIDPISMAWDPKTEFSVFVETAPENTKWFIFVEYTSDTKKDLIEYHSVTGNELKYYRCRRDLLWNWSYAETHLINSQVQINDVAQWLNYLFTNTDDFWHIVTFWTNALVVKWGKVLLNDAQITVADLTENSIANNTYSIIFNYDTQVFEMVTSTVWIQWLLVWTVVISAGTPVVTDLRWYNMPVKYDPAVFQFVDGELKLISWVPISAATEGSLWSIRLWTLADHVAATTGAVAVQTKNLKKTSAGAWDENKVPILDASWKLDSSFIPATADILATIWTAWENLSAGKIVYTDLDWLFYKVVKKCSTVAWLWSITWIKATGFSWFSTRCEYLSDNTALICYMKTDNITYWRIVTWVRWTPTVWAEQTLTWAQNTNYWFDLCILSSTLFVVGYRLNSDNKAYAVACSISWTTITVWTPVKLYDTETVQTLVRVCKVSATSFAASFLWATASDPMIVAATISWTTITAGSTTALKNTTVSNYVSILTYIQDWVICAAYTDSTNLFLRLATVSWSTITLKTELATWLALPPIRADNFFALDDNKLVYFFQWNAGEDVIVTFGIADQSSWTVPNIINTFKIDSTHSNFVSWAASQAIYLWDNKIAVYSIVTNWSDGRLRILNLWYNDVQTIFDATIAWTVLDISLCKLTLTQDKVLLLHASTGTLNYSLYWNTEKLAVGVVKTTVTATNPVEVTYSWPVNVSWLVAWQAYFAADDGAVSLTWNKQLWISLTTWSLLLK